MYYSSLTDEGLVKKIKIVLQTKFSPFLASISMTPISKKQFKKKKLKMSSDGGRFIFAAVQISA
jgi:predicted secreted protein